jgi:hypothetical protein
MLAFFIGNPGTSTTAEKVVTFYSLNDSDGLPIPLSFPTIWKLILSVSLLVILILGTRMRVGIICYINSPESKLGAINYLIWIDEINGVFLGISIVVRILFILSPYPIISLLGNNFCLITEFFATIYITGTTFWGCYIAVFRVLFIKGQTWLKNWIGVGNLLWLMLTIGVLENIVITVLSLYVDEESIVKRFCNHLSIKDFEILEDYKVSKKINNKN